MLLDLIGPDIQIFLDIKNVNVLLSVGCYMCFGCSKEPSH